MVDGRLLKTDKSFSDLKLSQREKIAGWLYDEYLSMFKANGNRYSKRFDDEILSNVYAKFSQAKIWLPYGELVRYFFSKKKRFENRALKSAEV